MKVLLITIVILMVYIFNPLTLILVWITTSSIVTNFINRPNMNPFFGSYRLTDPFGGTIKGFDIRELFVYDRIVLLLILVWVFLYNKKEKSSNKSLDLAFLILLIALFFACLHSNNIIHAIKVITDSFGLCYVTYYIGKNKLMAEKEHGKALTAIILLGVVLVLTGLVENHVFGDITGYRVTGPFRFWENYGLTLLIIFYVLWYKLNSMEMAGNKRLLFNILIIFVGYSIFLSETRTIMLALIIGITIVYMKGFKYLHRKTFYFYLSITVIAIASIIISPALLKSTSFYQTRLTKKETADGRIETYKVAVRMLAANPVVGIGIRNFQDEMEAYTAGMDLKYSVVGNTTLHNSYLVLAAETGITGLIPLLLIIVLAYKVSNRLTLSDNKNDRLWGLMMVGLTVSYFLCGLTFDPFFEPNIDNKLYYLCLGITAGKLALVSGDHQ